jgi:hypothetical protein
MYAARQGRSQNKKHYWTQMNTDKHRFIQTTRTEKMNGTRMNTVKDSRINLKEIKRIYTTAVLIRIQRIILKQILGICTTELQIFLGQRSKDKRLKGTGMNADEHR